jgi:sugar lactone lactonase YvrE
MRALAYWLILSATGATGQEISYTIATLAGSSWVGDGGPAISAVLLQAEGIAADVNGNLYISDSANHRVRKVTPAGVIATVAGTGFAGFSGDGGPSNAAQLNSPYGIALDGTGNVYIADLGNARVRKIDGNGIVTTVAGGGSLPAGGANDGSAATLLSLTSPRNVAWDGRGAMYISDFGGQRVYRLAQDGTLTTAAGTGLAGFSGDGFAATGARLSYPAALAFDRAGNLYIGDTQNHLIRKVSNGSISSIARAALPTGMAVDNFSTIYVADQGSGEILTIQANGTLSAFAIAAHDVCFGSGGYLYAANVTVAERISFTGSSLVVAGGGSPAFGDHGPATAASLQQPAGISADALGNIYIVDRENNRIRKVAPDGTISTVAGTGVAGNSGDEALAVKATLNAPTSVTTDAQGNLYIADTGNHRIRIVSPSGTMLPFPSAGLSSPVYAVPDGKGNVFVSDSADDAIIEAMPDGVVTTVLANLKSPRGMTFDSAGNLYFTEAGGPHVKRLGVAGDVTLIGEGVWNIPRGVAVDGAGNIYVADTGLQQVLRVGHAGAITAIAGTGTAGFSGDGRSAPSAELNFPWDVAVGSAGMLYIADLENNRVRSLTPETAANLEPILVVSAVNAASLQPGPLAPGMLLDLVGTGLASSDVSQTQVLFGSISAPILSLTRTGLLVRVPPELEGQQSVNVQILNQGNLLAQIPASVADAAPALYVDASGNLIADNQDGTPRDRRGSNRPADFGRDRRVCRRGTVCGSRGRLSGIIADQRPGAGRVRRAGSDERGGYGRDSVDAKRLEHFRQLKLIRAGAQCDNNFAPGHDSSRQPHADRPPAGQFDGLGTAHASLSQIVVAGQNGFAIIGCGSILFRTFLWF